MEIQKPRIANAILRKKNELEESTFLTSDYTTKPQFKTVWYWHKNQKYRSMEQDRKPRNKPMHLWIPYFFFNKGGKNIQWGKDSLFSNW